MKKRPKDFAVATGVPLPILNQIAVKLDEDESHFFYSWNKHKKNGTLRPINAPIEKLKAIQRRILEKVLYKIELPPYCFGGIREKNDVLNAKHHQGNKYFFQTDLKNFFPSISARRVELALRAHGFYPDVARLITRLSTKSGCIPQGCPTSSFLATLVLINMAKQVFDELINENKKVSIFIDDLTISSPTDFKPQTASIISELRKRGLKINFEKTTYKSSFPIVTGVEIHNNKILPQKETRQKLDDPTLKERSLKGVQNRIKYIKRISKK